MTAKFLMLISFLYLFPASALAAFERDLYFGLRGDAEVAKMQEFLRGQDVYDGPATGNFFTQTLKGVKRFQEREGISPSAGYFGPLTRAKANALFPTLKTKEESIAELKALIKNLQEQLLAMQAKLAEEQKSEPEPVSALTPVQNSIATATPDKLPEETPAVLAPVPAKTNKLLVSNSATSTFPAVTVNPFKIGEIILHNDTDQNMLFIRFETILSDEMDSTFNRNHKVYFLLRDGTSAIDAQISKTEFTFILTPPVVGSPHKIVLHFPFAVLLKAGEKKTVGLWVEQLEYVRSGTLKIESSAIATVNAVTIQGGINLVLTKEPPL